MQGLRALGSSQVPRSHKITHVLLALLLGGGEEGGCYLKIEKLLLNCVAGNCRKIAFNNLKLVVGWASVR